METPTRQIERYIDVYSRISQMEGSVCEIEMEEDIFSIEYKFYFGTFLLVQTSGGIELTPDEKNEIIEELKDALEQKYQMLDDTDYEYWYWIEEQVDNMLYK